MLVHYRCGACGAALAVRDDWQGRTLPCSLCRHPNVVPYLEPAVPRAGLQAGADEAAWRQFSAMIERETEEEAQRIAWAQARRKASATRVAGGVIVTLGFVLSMAALAAIVTGLIFALTFSSLSVLVAFGTLAMLIGLRLWRSASSAVKAEYRHLVPVIADRIRQERWQAWEAERRGVRDAGVGISG